MYSSTPEYAYYYSMEHALTIAVETASSQTQQQQQQQQRRSSKASVAKTTSFDLIEIPTQNEISQSPYYTIKDDDDPSKHAKILLIEDEHPCVFFHSKRLHSAYRWISTIDGIVAISYFCNVLARALPVLLVPIAVEERVLEYNNNGDGTTSTTILIASQVAHITSLAFTGGALGKFVNGFVCQRFGTYGCSRVYLVGLCCCSFLFGQSRTAETMGLAYAGMEFCASLQYGSMAVMVSNYYAGDGPSGGNHKKLAAALTALGLASTSGEIIAKLAGTFLAGKHHWRSVAKVGAIVALLGALIIAQAPGRRRAQALEQHIRHTRPGGTNMCHSMLSAVRGILGSRSFWILAFCYSMVFVCACSDRILVSFYYDITNLPHNVCGGMTLSVTLGLVHGLLSGSKQYTTLETKDEKMSFLQYRYMSHVLCGLGLAGVSYYGPIFIAQESSTNTMQILSEVLVAMGVVILSAAMASTIAFQYFQLPAMIAQTYGGDNKAVCISWLDGIGYMFSIPTFRALGVFVVPRFGWPAGWLMLSCLFFVGAIVMLCFSSIGSILDTSKFHEDDDEVDSDDGEGDTTIDPVHSHRRRRRRGDNLWRFFDWALDAYSIVAVPAGDLCYGGNLMRHRYMPHQEDPNDSGRELYVNPPQGQQQYPNGVLA